MPAKVISLIPRNQRIKTIIDETLKNHPPHPCPEVIECVKSELEKILEKYFIEDSPELFLTLPSDLTREQFLAIKDNIHQVFSEHNERMVERSKAIFHDLYLSKLEICTLKNTRTTPSQT